MNILILGPQGSGKGTQARLIAESLNLFYFESGSFLRDLAKENKELSEMLNRGVLVPQEETSSYITAFFDSKALYDDIVLDGFPRSLDQYEVFKNWLRDKDVRLDVTFVLNLSEEESVRRLESRRQDPETGKIYNLVTDPPPAEVDKDKLVQREDDKPEAIKKRLEAYKAKAQPLIEVLKHDSRVVELDGSKNIDEIHREMIKVLMELQR